MNITIRVTYMSHFRTHRVVLGTVNQTFHISDRRIWYFLAVGRLPREGALALHVFRYHHTNGDSLISFELP